jgi:hypothetical protein
MDSVWQPDVGAQVEDEGGMGSREGAKDAKKSEKGK